MHTSVVEYLNDQYDLNAGVNEEYICHHNGDYSGDMKITLPSYRVSMVSAPEWPEDGYIVEIPFEVLKELVADYLRSQLIQNYENMDTKGILGRVLL